MTKAELMKLIERFPDDIEIRMGIRKDTGTYTIDRADKFQGDIFITLEPGSYKEENE
jgi:hypothetical protein